MKTKIIAAFFTASLLLHSGVQAGGVPVPITLDYPAAVNQIQTMAQWATQLEKMTDQYTQMKAQYNAITGSRGLGNILNNPLIQSALPRDWQDVLSSIKSTTAYVTERAKYPTLANSPKKNALFDTLAANSATMSKYFTQANDRLGQTKSLMGQIDLANDPAAKADLQARLISEQNAISGTTQLLGILKAKQEQEIAMANQEAEKEYMCKEFKRPSC